MRHLYCRLRGEDYTDDERIITPEELNSVIISKNTIYVHKILRVNYTTYDSRREQDSINARTHPDVMLLSRDDRAHEHPYWYARVCGIFHVNAYLEDPHSLAPAQRQTFEILLIRWYGLNYRAPRGWKAKQLPIVGYVNPTTDNTAAFDLINPFHVIRAAHLIPDFTGGSSTNGLGPTAMRPDSESLNANEDYNWYYVNV